MIDPVAAGMRAPAVNERRKATDLGVLAIAAAVVLLLLASSTVDGYGYFIDELYYLACARRPALGYVDHPPLAPLVLAAVRATLGESLLAIRILPALAAGASAIVTAKIVAEAGGDRFAMRLAALSVAAMPVTLVVGSFYSMNAFELLIWTLASLIVSRIARQEPDPGANARRWLALGLVIGVGFLLKHTILVFVTGLVLAVVLTGSLRRELRTRWPWLGAAVALAVALPNLIWQIQHDFVSLEFYRGATAGKNIALSPLGVLLQQVLVLHPLLVPLWTVGVVTLFASRELRSLRWAGIAWTILLVLLMLTGTSRPDRITGLAPMLFVAGAIRWERWLRRPAARAGMLGCVALAGIALAPLNAPLLGYEATARYAATLGVVPQIERGKSSPLPQWIADRTGWEAMLDDVTRVVDSLPADERANALIYTTNYGDAGALELWGPSRRLPAVISPHNSYFHFSQGRTDSAVLIAIGASEERLRSAFGDVRAAGTTQCDYCMSWRNDRRIFVARLPLMPLSTRWSELRRYQ